MKSWICDIHGEGEFACSVCRVFENYEKLKERSNL